MYIYIHTEIAARELDSKLLLAVIAASRGHHVVVSDMNSLALAFARDILPHGIFHTKSLTPSKQKLSRHQFFVSLGHLITSLDEEPGLVDFGYDKPSTQRFSPETLEQASAVFCWGPDDYHTLRSYYPSFQSKFYPTGSPRFDLWQPSLASYWPKPASIPNRPYLLVSSNLATANHRNPFHERIAFERGSGCNERDSSWISSRFGHISEEYRLTYEFILAIRQLAVSSSGFDIVFRPHPAESVDAWKEYLHDLPNVHVIREGSISPWLHHSFAVMHNGCTTALESTISNIPVISYVPFKQTFERRLPNTLGHLVSDPTELATLVNLLYTNHCIPITSHFAHRSSDSLSNKFFPVESSLSAQRIVDVWESLPYQPKPTSSQLLRYRIFLLYLHLKSRAAAFFYTVFRKFGAKRMSNPKFPPLDQRYISKQITALCSLLGVQHKLHHRIVSPQFLLLSPNTKP